MVDFGVVVLNFMFKGFGNSCGDVRNVVHDCIMTLWDWIGVINLYIKAL